MSAIGTDVRKFIVVFGSAFLGSILGTGAVVIICCVMITGTWAVSEFATWIWGL